MSRIQTIVLAILLATAILAPGLDARPASAERPRPLGWALEAARDGNWESAARIAARDGQVAEDVIEWMRLRAGLGRDAVLTGQHAGPADGPAEERRLGNDRWLLLALVNAGMVRNRPRKVVGLRRERPSTTNSR